MQILVSPHGNHSPEKWASATASMIFPVEDAQFTGDRLIEAKTKEVEIISLLAKHYAWHSKDEQDKLAAKPEHIVSPLGATAKDITSKVVSLMVGSSWQDHFTNADVQDAVESVIKSHTLTCRYVERSWHADRNMRNPYARQFKEAQ